jgi:hypothetical protein
MASFIDLIAQSIHLRREEFLAGLSSKPDGEVEHLLATGIQNHWHSLISDNSENTHPSKSLIGAVDGSQTIRALNIGADWTAGSWNSGSLAFAIPPGLVEHRATTLSLFSAFVAYYGSRCLSARGKFHDLQHLSPMLTHDGNSVCRDMAHVFVRPVNTGIPHAQCSSLQAWFLSARALLPWRSKRDSLMIGSAQERCRGSTSFLNRSSRVEDGDFPWRVQQLYRTCLPLFQPYVERACS